MQLSITQLVIGTPPSIKHPSIHIVVDGIERTYNEKSILAEGRKAFIEVDEFWLIYTDGFEIKSGCNASISITSNNITVGSIVVNKLPLGIGRYYKKEFKIQRHLPDNMFMDIIVERPAQRDESTTETVADLTDSFNRLSIPSNTQQTPAFIETTRAANDKATYNIGSLLNEEQSGTPTSNKPNTSCLKQNMAKEAAIPAVNKEKNSAKPSAPSSSSNAKIAIFPIKEGAVNNTAKIFSKMPSPPGMRVLPAVNILEKTDSAIKTLFPKVGWKPVLSIKGSLYESPVLNESELSARWVEIENDFKKKFCIKREVQKTDFLKKDKALKKERILSERQEFLLSIVFESLKKSKLSLDHICNQLVKWTETKEAITDIDSIVNLSAVFPHKDDCNKIIIAKHALTEVENKVKFCLEKSCTKDKFLLIKYVQWADSSLASLIHTLQETRKSLIFVENDKQLPRFLMLLLRMGNLVNYKYAEAANKFPAKGFYLSSVGAFSKCSAEIINEDGRKNSLLEFLIITVCDQIDFKKIVSSYSFFKTIQLKSLKDHYAMLRAGYDEVNLLDEFVGKKEKLHRIFLLIRECEYLISEIDTKIFVLSKLYADTPEYISENMIDVITSIEKCSHLFK
ncbi:hypothetical protein NEIRO03_1130 [Nematocida sp. AWRm78]|nr:hypothetical protein NEIRO02_1499 [Nematocida sp. AWRm79]KAI5183542.1 hypothetical protein NEIRO03_1130 [Nematocida sp. AWRm78]